MSKFVEAVVHLLKLDDEGKVSKFQKQSLEEVDEQIETREKATAKLRKKKVEYESQKAPEKMHKLSIDSIGTIDDREQYFENTFLPTMFGIKNALDDFDAQIETKEKEIEAYKWVKEQLSQLDAKSSQWGIYL